MIAGMILSICGMLVTVLSFQIRGKRNFLLAQTAGSVFYLVSYIFSGGGIAVYLNAIYLVRNAVFYVYGGKSRRFKAAAAGALCACYAAAYAVYISVSGIETSDMLWNLLPVCGALFGTVAVAFAAPAAIRAWKAGDSVCWLAFNAHIGLGALGGVLGEVFNLVSIAVGVLRFKQRGKAAGAPPAGEGGKDMAEGDKDFSGEDLSEAEGSKKPLDKNG